MLHNLICEYFTQLFTSIEFLLKNTRNSSSKKRAQQIYSDITISILINLNIKYKLLFEQYFAFWKLLQWILNLGFYQCNYLKI